MEKSGVVSSRAEYVSALEHQKFGDAAALPVLDALDAASLGIESKKAGDLRRAAEAVNQGCVGVALVHGPITHRV